MLSPIVTRISLVLRQIFSAKSLQWWLSYLPFSYNQWKFSLYWSRSPFSLSAYGVMQEKHTKRAKYLWFSFSLVKLDFVNRFSSIEANTKSSEFSEGELLSNTEKNYTLKYLQMLQHCEICYLNTTE